MKGFPNRRRRITRRWRTRRARKSIGQRRSCLVRPHAALFVRRLSGNGVRPRWPKRRVPGPPVLGHSAKRPMATRFSPQCSAYWGNNGSTEMAHSPEARRERAWQTFPGCPKPGRPSSDQCPNSEHRSTTRPLSGEDRIRTCGGLLHPHRFSKPTLSTTQPPLRARYRPRGPLGWACKASAVTSARVAIDAASADGRAFYRSGTTKPAPRPHL